MSNYYIMHSKDLGKNYELIEVVKGQDIRGVRKLANKKYGNYTIVWKESKYKYMFGEV